MIKVALISLGCAKNTVDSEALLALFKIKGFLITTSLEDSDVIIINTCGFIEPSKEEAINTILECEKYHKKLIVTGCLVERYKKQLEEEMPEVDLFISLKEYEKLPKILNGFFKEKGFDRDFDIFNRVISTGSYTAYLKISEGCDNFCAFCAIPFIRGRFHSYPMNDLITYAKELAKNGCKELVVISQDTVNYGKDLDDKNANLLNLLKELDKIDGIEFIRTLYMYPEGISDELLYFIRDSKKMTHYLDIPLQHCDDEVLKRMNRKDTKKTILSLYKRIKNIIPDAILRTTLITGFPGETEDAFNELKEFIKHIQFNHLGVFPYSKEEGTKGSFYKDQIPEEIKNKRKDEIMEIQKGISYKLNKALIGKETKAIITKVNPNNEYEVRCGYNAPDDIDGSIIVKTNKMHQEGDIIKIKITNAFVYDLLAKEI